MRLLLSSFAAVEVVDAKVLVLGTMPSVESLRRQEYYGFKHNKFWPIMGELFGFSTELEYEQRCEKLRENKIALWDVLASCDREGSLDSNIKDEVPNDFAEFFAEHRDIRAVFFNGGPAERLFKKHVMKGLPVEIQSLPFKRLPSTSPANANMRYEQKLEKWRVILEFLEA